MKFTKMKTYLSIPVFLGMALLSGQVAADEHGQSVTQPTAPSSEGVAATSQAAQEQTATRAAEGQETTLSAAATDAPVTSADQAIANLPSSGVYTFTERTGIKSEPSISSPDKAYYESGETVNYDKKLTADNHHWLTYIGYSGNRNYVAIGEVAPQVSTPATTITPTSTPAGQEPKLASVEVADYQADKPEFTVKVTGSAETKQVSAVRVAVWSANKGQDDLKWYEPAVRNNQANVKVNIANHSNTSDDYLVHVYTTYSDQTTVGTDLGTYRINKKEPKLASVEVADYQADKPEFTVKVTGSAETKQVSAVRVAVWSANKGQDDLKWYEPAVRNNQANVKVNIANHSNTSDDYLVHVYTTYSDQTTVGTDLGTYRINKKEPKLASVEVADYQADKPEFTVKVTGSAETKQVSAVRVAVWSASKGQDDLKWYEPAVRNNQANVKVNIANHSNTSDDYLVHVYTTYSDQTTVGTDLGTYRINKKEPKLASVEVADYKSDKPEFTVKVTGSAETKQVSAVRVAVWSANKGQDDLKWYEPAVTNNQANVKVNIANHSNTSDDYLVHVYTTYSDQTTVGTDLGTYRINKTEPKLAKVELLDYDQYKNDFVVKVTGDEAGQPVSRVRVAVWSASKGQDDLKWYEPAVSDNGAEVRVNIRQHANQTDDYLVHVYTTYADQTTVGTDLGRYRIERQDAKNAQAQVVANPSNPSSFTVKVGGDANTQAIKQVRIAVWSETKGRDDLRWYEPKLVNNSVTQNIVTANHSSAEDNYVIHVYTTYADGQTLGEAVDYKFVKPSLEELYGTPLVNETSAGVQSILTLAGEMLGVRLGDPAHKQMVDEYNAVKPLPVGYKVTYEDDWCDVFTTVIFQRAGLSHLIGRECGVERHTRIFKDLGIWNENGRETPRAGDLITFNWDQNHQDNDGFADHIGIVTHVENGKIHTIEGNNENQVRRRTYDIGHGNIRGFARPNYS